MDKMVEEFKLTCSLNKAYTVAKDDGQIIKFVSGLASGKGIDLENERMSTSVLESFQKAINEGITDRDGEWMQIPLRSGHRTEWDDILGYIVSAELDKDHNLWINAELEEGNPNADLLYKRLTTPKQDGQKVKLGLSVGGKVISAGHEYDDETQSLVRTYYQVALKEISVVGQPAYPTAYVSALNKSVKWEAIEKKEGPIRLVDDNELKEFLTKENLMDEGKDQSGHDVQAVITGVDQARAIAKASVLGKWVESDVVYNSLEALSSNLRYFIGDVMAGERSSEEKQTLIAAGLSEFTKLVTAVSGSVLSASELQGTTKAIQEATDIVSKAEKELTKNKGIPTDEVVESVEEDATKSEEIVEEVLDKSEEAVKEALEEVEDATKSEEVTEEDEIVTEKSLDEKVDSLTNDVTSLAKLFADYLNGDAKVEETEKSEAEENGTDADVSKAEESVDETPVVQKADAESESIDDVIKGFISQVGEMMDEKIQKLADRLTAIEEAPVDKSLSVADDKSHVTQSADEWNEEAKMRFAKSLREMSGKDAIAEALKKGYKA